MGSFSRLLALAFCSLCITVLVGAVNTNFEAGQRVLPASITLMAEEAVEPRRNDQEIQRTVARKRATDEKNAPKRLCFHRAPLITHYEQACLRREAASARAPPAALL